MPCALVVDDDRSALKFLSASLDADGWTTSAAASGTEALKAARQTTPAILVTDVRLPDVDGFELVASLRRQQPHLPVVFVTGYPDLQDAMRAAKMGALGYLAKPFPSAELRKTCAGALPSSGAVARADIAFEALVGTSAAMHEVRRQVSALAPLPSAVLIRGETGTGKELVARALHVLSKRSGPFVPANMAAFASTLIEDALFGHERGAFTGADAVREGLFEQSRGGTVFLDEIGDLAPELQAKLLRVLDTYRVTRLGSHAERRIDVRIVAATSVDLETAQSLGRFRPDLYYRLQQNEIRLQALRERDDDIVQLVEHYLVRIGDELGRPFLTLAPGAMRLLRAHPWPGNIRELQSALRRASMATPGLTIEVDHLPAEIRLPSALAAPRVERRPAGLPLARAVDEVAAQHERQWIQDALAEHRGDLGAAALALGIDPKTLYEKRRRYGL